jgi:hypothetical protein
VRAVILISKKKGMMKDTMMGIEMVTLEDRFLTQLKTGGFKLHEVSSQEEMYGSITNVYLGWHMTCHLKYPGCRNCPVGAIMMAPIKCAHLRHNYLKKLIENNEHPELFV